MKKIQVSLLILTATLSTTCFTGDNKPFDPRAAQNRETGFALQALTTYKSTLDNILNQIKDAEDTPANRTILTTALNQTTQALFAQSDFEGEVGVATFRKLEKDGQKLVNEIENNKPKNEVIIALVNLINSAKL